MFALTKIDLYPQWERIAELDAGHLARHALRVPMVAVSSVVRAAALDPQGPRAQRAQRLPDRSSRSSATRSSPRPRPAQAARSANEARSTRGDGAHRARGREVGDSATRRRRRTQSSAARGGRSNASSSCAARRRWSTIVSDRTADLSNNVMFEFRSAAMRTISRNMDEVVEGLSKGDAWDDMVHDLQADVADDGRQRLRSPSRTAAWPSATRWSPRSATRTSTSTSDGIRHVVVRRQRRCGRARSARHRPERQEADPRGRGLTASAVPRVA